MICYAYPSLSLIEYSLSQLSSLGTLVPPIHIYTLACPAQCPVTCPSSHKCFPLPFNCTCSVPDKGMVVTPASNMSSSWSQMDSIHLAHATSTIGDVLSASSGVGNGPLKYITGLTCLGSASSVEEFLRTGQIPGPQPNN